MTSRTTVVLVFAFVLLANSAWSADKEEPTSSEALISRARSQEEIWTDGTPPMFMRAELQVFDAKGSPVNGYSLEWVSASKWREEIRFGKYERLRVGDAKGYWQTTGLSYQPESIFQLDTLLHLKDVLKVRSKQSLGKAKGREKAGLRQKKCTEVKWTKATERIMCFDDANGALVSVDYPRGENQNPPEISRIEYGAFNIVGGKLVPYEVRALKDGKPIAAVRVLEITKIAEENPVHLTVPVNAEFWAQCDDLQEAQPVSRIQPSYPPSARANHEQGRVILYAVLEVDGSLSHLTIIRRATPNLEAAAVEAVRHWHYKPATCGKTPIRMEISIETDFWLQY